MLVLVRGDNECVVVVIEVGIGIGKGGGISEGQQPVDQSTTAIITDSVAER